MKLIKILTYSNEINTREDNTSVIHLSQLQIAIKILDCFRHPAKRTVINLLLEYDRYPEIDLKIALRTDEHSFNGHINQLLHYNLIFKTHECQQNYYSINRVKIDKIRAGCAVLSKNMVDCLPYINA